MRKNLVSFACCNKLKDYIQHLKNNKIHPYFFLMRLHTDFQEKLTSLLSTASFFVVFYNYSDNKYANNTKVGNFGLQNNEKMLVSCQKELKRRWNIFFCSAHFEVNFLDKLWELLITKQIILYRQTYKKESTPAAISPRLEQPEPIKSSAEIRIKQKETNEVMVKNNCI